MGTVLRNVLYNSIFITRTYAKEEVMFVNRSHRGKWIGERAETVDIRQVDGRHTTTTELRVGLFLNTRITSENVPFATLCTFHGSFPQIRT